MEQQIDASLSLSNQSIKTKLKKHPDWSGSVGWASSCKLKCHQFHSVSGHTPRLGARSLVIKNSKESMMLLNSKAFFFKKRLSHQYPFLMRLFSSISLVSSSLKADFQREAADKAVSVAFLKDSKS